MAIQGNNIGTDARGFKAIGNQYDGVLLSGSDNTVGGPRAQGNVISGNGRDGISDGEYTGSSGRNTIEGNVVGLGGSGSVPLGNGQDGIAVDTNFDQIGGPKASMQNIVSGNRRYGILLGGDASFDTVSGNAVGTDSTGTLDLGNAQDGIHIQDNAANNTIGGMGSSAANLIAYSGGAGVGVVDNTGSEAILVNSIFSNNALGIDLGDDGVTPNSPGGGAPGPNGFQNYPVLDSPSSTKSSTTIQGTMAGNPPRRT